MKDCRFWSAQAHLPGRWKLSLPNRHRERPAVRSRRANQRGSTTVEMVLLAPVLMMLILLIVFAGRLTQANSQVRHAADQAARVASQKSDANRDGAATAAALADLSSNGIACLSPNVSISTSFAGQVQTVTATVSCEVNRSELAPLAPGAQRLVGTSTEVIDRRRGGDQRTGG
jgi:Flp pilus assembly protein TadG